MLDFTIKNARQTHSFRHEAGPVIFGRSPKGDGRHFIVDDAHVSRTQMTIEPTDDGIKLTNHGLPITVGEEELDSKQSATLSLPTTIKAGYTVFEIDVAKGAQTTTTTGGRRTIHWTGEVGVLEAAPTAERLAEWFQTLLSVQRAAAGSPEFYDQTVRAIVDLIGLDRGIVLLRKKGEWEAVATHPEGTGTKRYSRTVLAEVLATKQTVFEDPKSASTAESLQAVDAFVASPVLDGRGEVIGALFGARDRRPGPALPGIERLEAQIVQVLAAAVSAGLARLEQEAAAARLRVQFERVFSAELVHELERNPRMLEPADRTITVLFSDLRGFTRLAERIDGAAMFALVREVMDKLTERVLDEDGVIIDYYGDGMAAMWNAPLEHEDHAERACRAALKMQADVAALDAKWRPQLETPLAIGIGVHTGRALVGNAGSEMRQKYGPRGHTVNLASRIEGATKQAGVSILLSDDARKAAGESLTTRRIGAVRMVGFDEPVTLFELPPSPDETWSNVASAYEDALGAFEQRAFDDATTRLASLADADGPSRLLLSNLARIRDADDEATQILLAVK